MTQLSYLWNGVVTGDSTSAPYYKPLFNRFIAGPQEDGVVIPGYLNDLLVYSNDIDSGMYVMVDSGAALAGDYIYINTDVVNIELTAAASGYFRHDYIALQVDATAQTVRLVVVEGTEVASLSTLVYPTLADGEYALASVFVSGDIAYLQDKYIYDLRQFAITNYTIQEFGRVNYNLIRNSEFMAWVIPATYEPVYWDIVSDSQTVATLTEVMSRGQAADITNGNLSQTFVVNKLVAPILTIKGSLRCVTSADVVTITLTNAASTVLKTLEYAHLVAGEEANFHFTVKDSEYSESYTITFDTDDRMRIGQCIAVQGYHPGEFRQFRENIALNVNIDDANWLGDAKSTGTTNIDLTADFGGYVLPGTKAVHVALKAADSGSAAGAASLAVQGYVSSVVYGRIYLNGIANDVNQATSCIVPVNQTVSSANELVPRFKLIVVATGALTLDAIVNIVGIII